MCFLRFDGILMPSIESFTELARTAASCLRSSAEILLSTIPHLCAILIRIIRGLDIRPVSKDLMRDRRWMLPDDLRYLLERFSPA